MCYGPPGTDSSCPKKGRVAFASPGYAERQKKSEELDCAAGVDQRRVGLNSCMAVTESGNRLW